MLGHWIAIYPVDSAIVHLAQLVVQKLESAVHQICTLLVSLIVIPQIVIYPRGSTIPRLNNQGQLNIWGEARPTHGNSPRRASLCWKSVYAISALCSQLFLYLIFYKDEHGAYESALSQYQIALEALLPILSGETTLIDIIGKWSKVLYTDGTHHATLTLMVSFPTPFSPRTPFCLNNLQSIASAISTKFKYLWTVYPKYKLQEYKSV